ncbi:MAG: SpoIIE family protein phosphatase [Bacteroidales bacterium]|nr:SpoIIE family protein phosphatase [Bacteroidales bacterium]
MPAHTTLTVRAVMEASPVVVPPECRVIEALNIMIERRISSVLVARGSSQLLGIFTERDLLRQIASASPHWRETPVSAWMAANPFTIHPDAGWDEAAGLMQHLRVRHLPVVENGQLIGVVSPRLLMGRRTEYLNRQIEERTAELRHANEQLMAKDAESLHNLRAAGQLQTRLLLPQSPPDWPEVRWAIHFTPLAHLGGDYYDFAVPDPEQIGFLIADASGHSLPAAMVAIMARFAFSEASQILPWPGEVLGIMNRRLSMLSEDRFVTAVYAVFDRGSRALRYASAGHPPPLRYEAATQTVSSLAGAGFLLGVVPEEVYAEIQVTLGVGDRICFYTDGLIEARNEIGELFGLARLTDCLREHGAASASELLAHILERQRTFSGTSPLTDDLTIAVAEILGPNN